MRLLPIIQDCVVFLGWEASPEEGGIDPIGTAFLLEHEGIGHLVTAQHVAMGIGDNPFVFRFNRKSGGSHIFHIDPLRHSIQWGCHSNPNVDVAILPFHWNLAEHQLRHVFFPTSLVARENSTPPDYGIGDPCYAVGLFRLLTGTKENMAVVHTGNLALTAHRENIPVADWHDPDSGKTRHVRAHLVGLHSLDGLSGSPVFVRPPMAIMDLKDEAGNRAFVSQDQVKLLGVWHGSWRAESLSVAADAVVGKARPSFGMGVVTPIGYVMEILDSPEMKEVREELRARSAASAAAAAAATPDIVKKTEGSPEPQTDNSSHKEDFTRLLGAAAKANKPAS
jgi:hypothetical protein